jgi:hypothetical protein
MTVRNLIKFQCTAEYYHFFLLESNAQLVVP